MLERGGIYLANLNPSKRDEPGKVRPVLVMQANALNQVEHSTVVVLPLTTRLVDESFPLRYRLAARDHLHQSSDILCDQIRAISLSRITSTQLTALHLSEILEIERQVLAIIDCE
jgi:mRNA interferase MazF